MIPYEEQQAWALCPYADRWERVHGYQARWLVFSEPERPFSYDPPAFVVGRATEPAHGRRYYSRALDLEIIAYATEKDAGRATDMIAAASGVVLFFVWLFRLRRAA